MDYGPFVVHVFDAAQRDFYQLEKLWGDRPTVDWAGAHTEGSMNVHVETAEGRATICGDVIYDINDQIVNPLNEIHDHKPRVTGNHSTTKRQEKAAIKKPSLKPRAGSSSAAKDRPKPPTPRPKDRG